VGVGFIVGPILGGITASISPAMPGLVAAAITAINLVVAIVILPESRQRRQTVRKATVPVRWRDLAPAVSVIFLATLAFSVMYVVFPLFGEQRLGATRSTVSYWFAFVGLVTAIVQGGLLGRLVRWLGEPGTARLGAALLAGGFLLVAPSVRGGEITATFYAALACLGAGFGMAGAAMTGLVSRRTAADRQGRVLGLTQSASAMARIVGPIAAGAIMQAKSAEGAFLASAGMAAIALAIAAGLGRRPPVAATPAS
jgi:predicted MFS family arabinose efflux permease